MEFVATVQGERYKFSPLDKNSYLVSGHQCEYILYKSQEWKCADAINSKMVQKFGEIIEEHLHFRN